MPSSPADGGQPLDAGGWSGGLAFAPRSTPGVVVATAFLCASFAPSLLPRSWLKQGIITGVLAVIGYILGAVVGGRLRRRPGRRLGAALTVVALVFVVLGVGWEADVRAAVDAGPLAPWEPAAAVALAVALGWTFLFVGRLLIALTRRLIEFIERFLGQRAAAVIGTSFALVVVIGLVQGVLINGTINAVGSTYTSLALETNPWISRPTTPLRSGSPASVVQWESLGRFGREFIGSGPTIDEIAGFGEADPTEPARVYVGLHSAPTLDERVDLLLEELERVGAFERDHLAVVAATGTGWVDEDVADAFEFLHGGNTTIAVMQYSFAPSWVAHFTEREAAAETATATIDAITDHLASLPAADRPHLTVVGQSLGSLGLVRAFDDPQDLLDRTDSALLVGPPRTDPIRAELARARNPDSPAWRPEVPAWPTIRFAIGPEDLETDGDVEVVYLQYASDPVGSTGVVLLFQRPESYDRPHGPDVIAAVRWLPIVTFFHSLGDLGFAMYAPDGHGHSYRADIVDALVALDAPADWTSADTRRLRDLVEARAAERAARSG